jgi:predicted anti-sigma-YlaC factor YlaD
MSFNQRLKKASHRVSQMAQKGKVLVAGTAVGVGTNAMASIDAAKMTELTNKVDEAGTDSVTIGLAVLGVFVLVFGIKIIKRWF